MRKEILKKTMKGTGGLKNFFKRMFASKSAAAKVVGGAGMVTVLYDVYAFAKENDGVVESDEVKSIIDRAKSKHPDMPQDFWDEMRRDMLDDIYKRENAPKKERYHFGIRR